MKISLALKRVIFIFLGLMYLTGLTQWIFKKFFLVDSGMGPEPIPQLIWFLRFHGTLSLAVLVLMGFILKAHLLPSWKIGKHKKSGILLSLNLFLIIVIIPFIMYLTDENLKSIAEQTHTYLGLFLIVPFLIHLLVKNSNNSIKK